MVKFDKKSKVKIGIIALLLITAILISLYVFAESAEEEKARLLAEKAELEQRLQEIDGGKWINVSVESLIANTTYSELTLTADSVELKNSDEVGL